MKGLVSKLDAGVKRIFGYVGIVMILIETYAVFARNVLKAPAPWTDETLKMLFVWSIFVCSICLSVVRYFLLDKIQAN